MARTILPPLAFLTGSACGACGVVMAMRGEWLAAAGLLLAGVAWGGFSAMLRERLR